MMVSAIEKMGIVDDSNRYHGDNLGMDVDDGGDGSGSDGEDGDFHGEEGRDFQEDGGVFVGWCCNVAIALHTSW